MWDKSNVEQLIRSPSFSPISFCNYQLYLNKLMSYLLDSHFLKRALAWKVITLLHPTCFSPYSFVFTPMYLTRDLIFLQPSASCRSIPYYTSQFFLDRHLPSFCTNNSPDETYDIGDTWIIVKTLTMDYKFFRFPIIHPLLLLINSFGFHDNIDDLNFMVIGKGNASVTGDMLDKN